MRKLPAVIWGRGSVLLEAAVVCLLIVAFVMVGVPGTGALFTADYPGVTTISAGQIFPDERVSPAFKVTDHSSGSGVDTSSPVAFGGDGLTLTTASWPATFSSGRYLDLHFSQSLPGNVALSAASFDLSAGSSSGSACFYFELRDQGGNLIDTEGNAGAPLACAPSAIPGNLVTPLPGVDTTDDLNAATLRVFVASSAQAAAILDRAVLTATYSAQQFKLYPVDVVDLADGSPALYHWGLAGP